MRGPLGQEMKPEDLERLLLALETIALHLETLSNQLTDLTETITGDQAIRIYHSNSSSIS